VDSHSAEIVKAFLAQATDGVGGNENLNCDSEEAARESANNKLLLQSSLNHQVEQSRAELSTRISFFRLLLLEI